MTTLSSQLCEAEGRGCTFPSWGKALAKSLPQERRSLDIFHNDYSFFPPARIKGISLDSSPLESGRVPGGKDHETAPLSQECVFQGFLILMLFHTQPPIIHHSYHFPQNIFQLTDLGGFCSVIHKWSSMQMELADREELGRNKQGQRTFVDQCDERPWHLLIG